MMVFATGDVYQGYWKNGTYGGKGRLIKSGLMYEGQWQAGEKDGMGVSTF
jgi:hypothetical protein